MSNLLIDVTRIASRIARANPTGIDRVELAYATGAWRRSTSVNLHGVVTNPFGAGLLPPRIIDRIRSKIEGLWRRPRNLHQDLVFNSIVSALKSDDLRNGLGCRRFSSSVCAKDWTSELFSWLPELAGAANLRRRVMTDILSGGAGAYLHTSHAQLEHSERFQWARRSGVKVVFFVHDAIPIEYPEFCSPGSARRHEGRLRTVSELAGKVVFNSQATKRAVFNYWRARGMRTPESLVAPLGVSDAFLRPVPQVFQPSRPYFVCVGTIEPRKNHLFLLNVWRELSRRMGPETPRLVVIGRRGWENENILDVFERSKQLADLVIEASGVSDDGLAALMASSSGLLAPSMAEGFSLPVAEALACKTPVIASDIDVHREVATDRATLLHPNDGRAWAEAIEALAAGSRRRHDEAVAPTGRTMSDMQHVDYVLDRVMPSGAQDKDELAAA